MNAESMTVDPNELVIDMPLDEANVKTKMESLAVNGVIQPVTVWLQGMRIIDGFHRTEAARRLGWTAIPCHVIDCSEAAFWDARIQSARQHHNIENERLQVWIRECWRSSDWPDVIAVTRAGEIRATNPIAIDAFVSTMKERYAIKPNNRFERWLVEDCGVTYWHEVSKVSDADMKKVKGLGPARRAEFRYKQKTAEDAISLNATNPLYGKHDKEDELLTVALFAAGYSKDELAVSLGAWFKEKANQWGTNQDWLIKAILSELVERGLVEHAFQVSRGIIENPTIGDMRAVAVAADLSWAYLSEQEAVEANDYLRNRQEGESLKQYQKRLRDKSILEYQTRAKEQARIDRLALVEAQAQHERQRTFLQTDAGKAQAEKERLQQNRNNVSHALNSARQEVRKAGYWLTDVPDAPAMLAEFAQFVADFAAEHFPGVEVAKPNPVSLENARLRAENAKLRERIASLERALGSKQAAGEMLSSAIAWSSGDLDR